MGFAVENMHEMGNNEYKFDNKAWEILENLRTTTWKNNQFSITRSRSTALARFIY